MHLTGCILNKMKFVTIQIDMTELQWSAFWGSIFGGASMSYTFLPADFTLNEPVNELHNPINPLTISLMKMHNEDEWTKVHIKGPGNDGPLTCIPGTFWPWQFDQWGIYRFLQNISSVDPQRTHFKGSFGAIDTTGTKKSH